MSARRARFVCAAVIACATLALLPATAGSHPAGCTGNAEMAAPTAEFPNWAGNDACTPAAPVSGDDSPQPARSGSKPPKAGSFKQVGHEPLFNRGMNAAIAIHDDYAYIGSRTDGGHQGQPHGGVLVVDIDDPSDPRVVGERFDANAGESSRELRVWRSQEILIVLNTNCGVGNRLHHCTKASISNIRFYDISRRNATAPKLLHQFDVDTHEFFLWEDPEDPERALIFAGNAGNTCTIRGGAESCPFSVWDISPVREGEQPAELYSGPYPYTRHPEAPKPEEKPTGGLHSLTISNDGSTAYFALLTGGFAVADVSDFAAAAANPQPRAITDNASRPTWSGPGAHSAAKLWGRDWAWVSDEVYGTATGSGHGCPWGWARMVDISDPVVPTVEADYREPENQQSSCGFNPPQTSYSAHNPTLTPNIAFSTWHSGGFQAVSVEDPSRPVQLAEFMPEPLDEVMLEDPRLSSDPDTGRNEKVVMWSYAIIDDGLIYLVDLRNGLYVLKYKGPFEKEVRRIEFLDGNSNQGDALCYEPVDRPPRHCR